VTFEQASKNRIAAAERELALRRRDRHTVPDRTDLHRASQDVFDRADIVRRMHEADA
jgi:hypothetical protein